MITIGYLDEANNPRYTFNRVFKQDFNVKMLDNPELISTPDELINQIEEMNLDVLAVDYKLADGGWLPYNGDEVVKVIWEKKRYFPVFMLTSYPSDAMSKMENVFLVRDKSIITDAKNSSSAENPEQSLDFLKEQIRKSVENYKIIITKREKQARELEEKQVQGLSFEEENDLLELHMELHAIDPKANPIAPADLQTTAVKKLQEMVDTSRDILKLLSK